MSSNSPVLLLAPSAVPTAPIMAPLLGSKPDMRARGLVSSHFAQEKSIEAPAVGKANLTLGVDAAESKSSGELSPVAPALPITAAPPTPAVVHPALAVPATTAAESAIEPIVAAPIAQSTQLALAVQPDQVAAAPSATPQSLVAPATTAAVPAAAHLTPVAAPVRPSVPAASLTRAAANAPVATVTTKRAAAVAAAAASAAPLSPAASAAASSPKTAPSSPSSPKSGKSSTGRWTEAEHKLFLKGLEQFPYRAWKKIATLIKTRTVVQIRTHAQKYYQKLEKEEQRMREREAQVPSQQGLSSTVSTPRAEVPSEPSTLAAAASASFQELSIGVPMVVTPSAASFASAFAETTTDADVSLGAVGKRKAQMRKRKGSSDELSDTPSSLPKRMMKEKKFVREKTMSPKQKTAVSSSRAFGFNDFMDASSGDDSAKGSSVRGLSALKMHPLDFDDDDEAASSTTGMMLNFTEEKPMVDYPFPLDSALERGLAAIDQDELLQLSDDEGLEWFSSAGSVDQDELMEAVAADGCDSSVGSPLSVDGQPFSPLYSEDSLLFVDPTPNATQCSTPSPILSSSADCPDFTLSGDEADDDEDFVLDPEKFLSSYFNPAPDAAS